MLYLGIILIEAILGKRAFLAQCPSGLITCKLSISALLVPVDQLPMTGTHAINLRLRRAREHECDRDP